MAHTGQVDGLEESEFEEQSPECSKRQGATIMRGLIHMMKQQQKEIKESPPSAEEVRKQQEDLQSENRGVVCASGSTGRGKATTSHKGSPIQRQD
eukprot:12927237-Prorocentrum_lima.AAC.1